MFFSDIVGNDCDAWKAGESIFVDAPTGSGKTFFILNQLVPKAVSEGKEVLFLSNRYLLREQLKGDIAQRQGLPTGTKNFLYYIEEFEGITVMTYQKLQKFKQHTSALDWAISDLCSRFAYVVFDEAHYFFADSLFNPEILWILDFIKKYKGVSIFLSATMEGLPEFIINIKYADKICWRTEKRISPVLTTIEFLQTTTWTCGQHFFCWLYHVKPEKRALKIFYYTDFRELLPMINDADSPSKWLVFGSSKDKIRGWEREIISTHEVIDADNKNSPEKAAFVREMLAKEKFSCKVLLTTSVLDNGVNLKDPELKNIVIETISKTEFLQMLGRKRIMNNREVVNLYIPIRSAAYFSSLLKLHLEPTCEVLNCKEGRLLELLMRDNNTYEIVKKFCCVVQGKLTINPVAKRSVENQQHFVKRMLACLKEDPWAFIKEQLSWIGEEQTFCIQNSLTFQSEERQKLEIQDILASYQGRNLDKEEQERFCIKINNALAKMKKIYGKKGRIPKKNQLNKIFMDLSIPFFVDSICGKKKGEITFWIIRRRG